VLLRGNGDRERASELLGRCRAVVHRVEPCDVVSNLAPDAYPGFTNSDVVGETPTVTTSERKTGLETPSTRLLTLRMAEDSWVEVATLGLMQVA
jgi:hypothetical protein